MRHFDKLTNWVKAAEEKLEEKFTKRNKGKEYSVYFTNQEVFNFIKGKLKIEHPELTGKKQFAINVTEFKKTDSSGEKVWDGFIFNLRELEIKEGEKK